MPLKLPVPRLEALVFCRDARRDVHGAFMLEGIGEAVALERVPGTISGVVFVRYAAATREHAAFLRIVEVDSGSIIDTYGGQTVGPAYGTAVSSLLPVTIPVRSVGLHALQLWVDGDVIGTAILDVRRGG